MRLLSFALLGLCSRVRNFRRNFGFFSSGDRERGRLTPALPPSVKRLIVRLWRPCLMFASPSGIVPTAISRPSEPGVVVAVAVIARPAASTDTVLVAEPSAVGGRMVPSSALESPQFITTICDRAHHHNNNANNNNINNNNSSSSSAQGS